MFLTPEARVRDYQERGWWSGDGVGVVLRRAVERGGDAEALVDPVNRATLDGRNPERLSWRQVGQRVDSLAAALAGRGLVKDDLVVAQLPNTVDAVLLFLACARMGLILSPVAMPYRAHELGHILDRTTPRAFVTLPRFAGFDHAGMARALAADRPGLSVLLFDDLRAEAAAAASDGATDRLTVGGEVLTICWTSGTEARPKGVPRDHNHWILNADIVIEGTGMIAGDVLLNPFPLVNIGSIGGLVMPWLRLATKLVLHHPFDLPVFLAQIEAERVSYTIAPPAVLTALLKQPQLMAGVDLSSLRAVGSGSAPLSPWLIEGWAERGIAVTNIFGSNEGTSLFSNEHAVPDCVDRARFFPRFGAAGQDWPGLIHRVIRTRLVDEAGAEITGPGQSGELRIAGGATFSGYWRSPELTAAAFDDQGYFRTGDLFEIAGDRDQFYRFVGRSKEIIVRGGINVSPAEVDDLLVGLPNVAEAATVGIPDEVLGERIAVAVVAVPGATPELSDVTEWLAARDVAIFKRPQRLVVVERLPRNPMNKVVRSELRAMVLDRL